MICPHCQAEIDDKLIASQFAKLGGSKKSPAKTIANRLKAREMWNRRKAEAEKEEPKEPIK